MVSKTICAWKKYTKKGEKIHEGNIQHMLKLSEVPNMKKFDFCISTYISSRSVLT
jgi:N6-adenosine-specific RNA methylase IME4